MKGNITLKRLTADGHWCGWADLCYSPDDGGYFGQRHGDDATTDLYPTREVLEAAIDDGSATWTNE